ncbi:MAG: hypothetical protein ACI9QC_000019 [Oceanicoccus sp.]|jgi:hypothetical protein
MKKHDDSINQVFIERFGSAPSNLGYTIDGPPLWLTLLLLGGIFSVFLQKPWMIGFYGEEIKGIKTSVWKTTTLKDETMTLKKSDIAEVKHKKFGPAYYFTVKTNDGITHRFVMNTLYKALEGQPKAIDAMKQFLGV